MEDNKKDLTKSEEQKPVERKLSSGLFSGFTLGATLKQGPTGNVMTGIKASPMDYEKTYKESTKNVQLSAQELQKISDEQKVQKAHLGFDKLKNKLAHEKNPPSDPAAVAAAVGRKKYGKKEMAEMAAEGKKKSVLGKSKHAAQTF